MPEKPPLFVKIGRYDLVRDPDVAHEAANTVNDLVDQQFSSTNWLKKLWWRVSKARSRFSEAQSTDALISAADSLNEQRVGRERAELERDTDRLTGLIRTEKHDGLVRQAISEYQNFDSDSEHNRNILAVAKLDIDLFSWWNDIGGRNFGNFALRTVGKIIRTNIRPNDIAIRFGGEEIVLIPNADGIVEGYIHDISRILQLIRTYAMRDITHVLLDGRRRVTVQTETGLSDEREGTVVLKGFAQQLLDKAQPNGLKYFMDHAKGGDKKKIVEAIFEEMQTNTIELPGTASMHELDAYRQYVHDDKTLADLEESENISLKSRQKIEIQLCKRIEQLFLNELTCSAGMVLFIPEDRNRPPLVEEINNICDTAIEKAKGKGKSFMGVRVGRKNNQIHVSEAAIQVNSRRRTDTGPLHG